MANSTTGNPWKLDTTGVISTNTIYVKRIRWTPTTDAHDILIHDNAGHEVWSLKAIAGDTNQAIPYWIEIDGPVNGINLVTLDSGTVHVYLR